MREVEKKINDFRREVGNDINKYEFTGVAFVILNSQTDVVKFIKFFEVSSIFRMIAYVIYKVFGFKKNKVGKRYYEDKSIYITRAVDPSEIFWENLNVKAYTKIKYSILIYLVMF